ncbi:MAG TPA: hypothetical protein EYN21_01835 [Candidatus Marinimicrobia bacterium]|nr:hypothetical protein [Candidatus Neomarinimicrobiota bacterium]
MKSVQVHRSFLLLVLSLSLSHGQQLAILDIAPVEIPETDALNLSEHFREVVSSKIGENIIPIDKVREVLSGDKVNNRWCAEEWCAREVGELLGVEKVIVSSIWKDGELYKLNGKVVVMADTTVEKEHTFNFAGEEESLIPEVEVMAYELFSKPVPQDLQFQHKYINERSLALQGITEKKTRLKAVLRSTALPGLGQVYLNKKLWGATWFLTELYFGAITLEQYQNYVVAFEDCNDFQDMYTAATNVDSVLYFRSEVLRTYAEVEKAIAGRKKLTNIGLAFWALNIFHAYRSSPSTQQILDDISFRFSHNPLTRESHLRLSFALDR